MRLTLLLLLTCAIGCSSHSTPGHSASAAPDSSEYEPNESSTALQLPVLYHRTGGIAGTDDRVVIWPDGFIQVSGKLMTPADFRVSQDRLSKLRKLLAGFENLYDRYPFDAIDAYMITITYGDKTVEASDMAVGLPPGFRDLFVEIESIAAEASQ